jgi:hypothetical protein
VLQCCLELTNISTTAATPEQLENVVQPEQVCVYVHLGVVQSLVVGCARHKCA